LDGIAIHTGKTAVQRFQLPLYLFCPSNQDRNRLDSGSIISTLTKHQLEIAVHVGMHQQSYIFLGRDIFSNKDACPFYGCAHYIDNMTAYLPGFGQLRERVRSGQYANHRNRKTRAHTYPPTLHVCHPLICAHCGRITASGRNRAEVPWDGWNLVVAGMPTNRSKLRNAPHLFQNIASFAAANCQEMMNNADYGTVTSPPVGLMP
jgi:hypothetical protein